MRVFVHVNGVQRFLLRLRGFMVLWFYGVGIWRRACARPGTWCGQAWGSGGMPAPALALGVNSIKAVLRPAGSPFMPLRCPHQAPVLRTELGGAPAVDRPPCSQELAGGVLSVAA